NTAPIKFSTSSQTMTTPEAGAFEFDGTSLFITDNTATRRALMTTGGASGGQSTTGSVTFTTDTDATGDGGLFVKSNGSTIFQVDNAGNTTLTGTSNFTTGSGNVTLNGATTLASGKSFTMAAPFQNNYAGSTGPAMLVSTPSLTNG